MSEGGMETVADGVVVVDGRGAERLRRGHPWVYRGDIARSPEEAGAYPIRDERGEELGTGFYSPASKISLRVANRDGAPVDEAYFRDRLEMASSYRSRWGLGPGDGPTTCYRLVHAEADGLPGVVVDRYGDWLSLQVSNAGVDRYADALVAALVERFEPAGVLARNDIHTRKLERLPLEVRVLHGEVPERVEVRENGTRLWVDLRGGQKTGAYLDQRDNRALAARFARGRVLDLFTYQGWFATQVALRAEEVTAVDASEAALEQLRLNVELNGLSNVRAFRSDVFDFLDAGGDAYDLIILDPPPFVKRKGDLRSGIAGYTRLNAAALARLAPGGRLLTFSCSHHVALPDFVDAVRRAARGSDRRLRLAALLDQGPDHPHLLKVPESGYLKGLVVEAMD